jgi:hypothetical protein
MRRNRMVKALFLITSVSISFSTVYSQTQILNNISFENTKSGYSHPSFCLPVYSGNGGMSYPTEVTAADYFLEVADWVSHYHVDAPPCNYTNGAGGEEWPEWQVHSPDLVGGGHENLCLDGWNDNFFTGMEAYEVIWQDFVGGNSSKYMNINKAYEVRIKIRANIYFAPPDEELSTEKTLDVLLGTQAFYYANDLKGLNDLFAPDLCAICNSDYRTYTVASTEDYKVLKRFEVSDLINWNPYSTYNYNGWFELHFKMVMSDYGFTNPFIPIHQFVQFGLDFRDPDPSVSSDNGSMCVSPYLHIDQVEFFESCPTTYEIKGAMISGQQSDYVATDHISAGTLGVGPAIITNNGKTDFYAGHYIELVPGFFADNGAVLDILAIPNVDCSLYRSEEANGPSAELNRLGETRTSPSAVVNKESDKIFKVYPNPASSTCVISTTHAEVVSISILDNLGKTMSVVENIHRSEFQLDISNLPNGTYSLVITTNKNETYHEKLIKM